MKWFDDTNPSYPKGAEICRHPFLDTQSFYGVSRRSPVFFPPDKSPLLLENPEKFCAFCMGRILEATPDKTRTLFSNEKIHRIFFPKLQTHEDILFRRQGNLFEIITFEYWNNKYGIGCGLKEQAVLDEFFSEAGTKAYLKELIRLKFSRINKDILPTTDQELREAVKAFFGGFHELLSSGLHFQKDARDKSGIFSSGNMTWQEHRISYEDLILAYEDMISRNNHIKYISIFQNWLPLAGASFEHWHKQILAADFWGKPLLKERDFFQQDPAAYQNFALATAVENDFILAENEYALAYTEVGSKSGFITITSKSANLLPHRHSIEEIHAMSDLVHAVCTCLGPSTPYNEEWFYTPFDADGFKTPWRVMIRLRSSTEAGFEHINQYLVSTVSQRELADTLRSALAVQKRKAPGIQVLHAKESHKKSLSYLG